MSHPRATPAQLVNNNLRNHKPVLCPVCDRFIGFAAGTPVVLDDALQIIEFVHPACCADRTVASEL